MPEVSMVSHSHHNSQGSDRLANGARQGNATPTQPKPRSGREHLAERGPSKDGTAQRAAAEVEGLKGYQLGEQLGKGAFGSVYRALNWGSGETVAVKKVKLGDLPKGEMSGIMVRSAYW
jgi:serine/threonine protein kinase